MTFDTNFDTDIGFNSTGSMTDLGEGQLMEAHRADMHGAVFDPDQIPMPPDGTEEGVLSDGKPVDLMGDTPSLDREVVFAGLDPGGLTVQTDLPDLGEL